MLKATFFGLYGLVTASLIQYSDNIPHFRFSFVAIGMLITYHFGEKLRKKLTKDK